MTKSVVAVLILACLLLPAPVTAQATIASAQSGNWSSPGTWTGGIVPNGQHVTIAAGHVVTFDSELTIAGMTIQNTGELRFAANATVTLQSTGNIVVYGKLTMRPATPTIAHTLRFINVDATKFVGSGMVPIATDVGLWVMCTQDAVMSANDPFPGLFACVANSPGGVLDIAGAPKLAWTHAAGAIAAGATQISLPAAPAGWQIGDTIVIAPTEPVSVGTPSWDGFDTGTITAINGNTVTIGTPTVRAHPTVTNPWTGEVYTAEVMNTTRNVRIEGTTTGRAHIFIRSTKPQTINYASLRYLGHTAVVGRYALHFHHSMDGSRGSTVTGTVITNSGGHGAVTHGSYGILIRDVVGYAVTDDFLWWDAPLCDHCGTDEHINDSHDITVEHTIAARVLTIPGETGNSLAAFVLRQGDNNSIVDSVAVGVRGQNDAAGFAWPEFGQAVWEFSGNLCHNSRRNCIFVWQNTAAPHEIHDVVAYHNGGNCVKHGAYRNEYLYDGLYCVTGGFRSNANSGGGQAIVNLYAASDFFISDHNLPGFVPVLVKDCRIPGVTVYEDISPGQTTNKDQVGQYDFVNCLDTDGTSIEASDFTLTAPQQGSVYRVQRPDGTAYQITGAGYPNYGGTVSTIPRFYTAPLSPIAQQIADWLAAYPDVRQELIDAGVIQ